MWLPLSGRRPKPSKSKQTRNKKLFSRRFGPLELLEDRRVPAVITVNTNADDLTPNDGSVSLREAITAINSGNDLGDSDITNQNPGTFGSSDTIDFSIGGGGVQTIPLTSDLPAIQNAVLIDGLSQPFTFGAPGIELDGTNATNGFVVFAPSTTIQGFIINDFQQNAILLFGGTDTVATNYIGTDATGTSAKQNGAGVGIFS